MIDESFVHQTRDALLDLSRLAARAAEQLAPPVASAAQLIRQCLAAGGKVLVCGNGGSAADAQHFAAELIGRFYRERKSLPAIALTTDSSVVTALGNDYGFEQVFSRQVEGLGEAGDVLVVLTTSGTSPNILKALAVARQRGLKTVSLVGEKVSEVEGTSDVCLSVPSPTTARIQEVHTALLHAICQIIDETLSS